MRRFRQIFYSLLPSWLTSGEGELVQYTLGLIRDHMVTRARLSLEARFPSRAGASALALIGNDRGLTRGRSESTEGYRTRLKAWRYPRGHRVRGNAFAVLEQIAAYWGPTKLDVFTVDTGHVRNRRQADGTLTTSYSTEWNWGYPEEWWGAFWVVLLCSPELGIGSQPAFGNPALWGGSYTNTDQCVGLTGMTPEDVVVMRELFRGRAWKPAGVRADWMVFSLDAAIPQPEDGDWQNWGRDTAGVRVPARDILLRYVSLSPEVNNSPAGYPDKYPASMQLPDGSTYAGNPLNYPATITLPNGRVYAGNPTNFPAKIRLVDDGDAARAL